MEEKNINRIMLYIIAMFLSSCSSNNKVRTFKRGENLIYKTIYDFDRNENTKKGEVYEVYEVDSTQSLKMLTLHRREFISVFRSDSVGSITPSIPTGFLELNHRLYVWHEKRPLPLKSDNIKILEKFFDICTSSV